MTAEELVDWLSVYGPPESVQAAKRLVETINAASREIGRLQRVIGDHTERLSRPIIQHYTAEATIQHDVDRYYKTETRIRLNPIKYEVTVPLVIGEWSDDHKNAFYLQIVEGASVTVGKCLREKLWPKDRKNDGRNSCSCVGVDASRTNVGNDGQR
jgi:hypothetical protein